jgi:hypothetical protein
MAKTAAPAPAAPAPKKGGLKRWLLILGGIAVLLFLVALIAPFFIPWDKLKDQATAFASEKLGRQLSIEKVDVSLFTGVKLVNVQLANGQGFSKDPLFSNASAKLDLSLLSLLTGKVVINAIEFKSPSILIEKDANGKFNFSDIGGKAAPEAAAPAPAKASASGAPPALPIVLASLVIDNGDIVYRDKAKGTETAIHGLDFKLLGFSLESGGDQRLELKLTAEVEGKKIPISLTSNFKLDLPGESVDLKSFELDVPSVKVTASGAVKGFKAPAVDVKASVAIALATVAQDLLPPSILKSVPGGLSLDGAINLDIAAKGAVSSLEKMDLNGALSFDKVGAKYGDYPALKSLVGTLKVDKAGADLPALTMDLGGSPVTLAVNAQWGSLDNLLGGPKKLKANVTYKLSSPKLVLDPVMDMAMAGKPSADDASKATAPAAGDGLMDLSGSVPAGLSLKGSILVDSMVYKQIKTGKLSQQISLVKQKLQSATNLDLYGGTFWERTNVDLSKRGPSYGSQSGLSGMSFNGLVDDAAASFPDSSAAQNFKGKVFGAASYKVTASGKGFKAPALMKNLKADGSFGLQDGKITKTDWQEKIASVIPSASTQAALRKDLVFQNLVGEFGFAANKMTLKSFTLGSGKDWRAGDILLQASGTLVPGGPIDFKVVPHFSPKSVQVGGEVGKAFEDDKGWATYNYIGYSGPTSKEAKADFSQGLQNAAKNAVNKKVDEAKQKATDAVKQQAGNALKKLPLPGGLNKLFGN